VTAVTSPFLGEFCGTLILILLGDGVVAGALLAKSKSHNPGWIVITTGWAFAVVCGIFVSKALGGPGELNPVGPLADILVNGGSVQKNGELMLAEFLGAFCGAILVWLQYLPHWSETKDQGAKLGVFCTSPAIRNLPANFLSEFIGTFALIFIAFSVGKVASGKTPLTGDFPVVMGFIQPTIVGLIVWSIGLSLGGSTGYAINPARDFGPRLAHALLPIAGKGGSDWGYAWVPVLGPFAGAIAAVALFKVLSST
jgi:glycerol uptake facilitator protein